MTPVDDGAFENDESVILTLRADAAYSLGSPATSTVTSVSDDLPPDLVVTTMTAPPSGGADSDIVVTETTKNQGTGASLPSKTGFYLSANTTLDAADPWIGDRIVSSVGLGVTAQASTTLHIPPSTATGLYWIIAKADWDDTVNESSEINNLRSGVIKIGPDLAVSALTAPATAAAGGGSNRRGWGHDSAPFLVDLLSVQGPPPSGNDREAGYGVPNRDVVSQSITCRNPLKMRP